MVKVSFNYTNERRRTELNSYDNLFEVEGVRSSNHPRYSLNPI